MRQLVIFKRIVADALGHFNDDDGWAMASHVAMAVLLAAFPFLIFATGLVSFIGDSEIASSAVDFIFDTVPEVIAKPIAGEVHSVLSVPRSDVLTFGGLTALIFASNGVEALRVALNRAYRKKEHRSFLFRRIQSLIFVLLATAALLSIALLLVLAPLAWSILLKFFPNAESLSSQVVLMRYTVVSGVLVIGLYASHLWLPAGERPFKILWPGILLTIIASFIGSILFASYLEQFATYASTYAGLAGGVIALLFLYLLAAFFIIGAEFNAAIGRYREARSRVTGKS
ncbi:MAG: YihY/virulence factor BrkB family protein [Rhizobiaceae bacterium]